MPSVFRPRFFLSLPSVLAGEPGAELPLSASDERHARLVLRVRPGDPCEVVLQPDLAQASADPYSSGEGWPPSAGSLFAATFVRAGSGLAVRLESKSTISPPTLSLLLLQALTDFKSVDLIVEKGTEVGVDAFLLFPADGSPPRALERSAKRVPRWRRVAEEAAKQSKQLAVPPVTLAGSLEEALGRAAGWGVQVLVLEPESLKSLRQAVEKEADAAGLREGGPVSLGLAVGPERGWSASELGLIAQRGLTTAGLGRRILRAETAGPVAAAVSRFALNDV